METKNETNINMPKYVYSYILSETKLTDQLKDTNLTLPERLLIISTEMKQLERHTKLFRQEIGDIYHKGLSAQKRVQIQEIKNQFTVLHNSKLSENLTKVNDYLVENQHKLNTIDVQEANEATDGAYIAVEASQKLPTITLEKFYDDILESACSKISLAEQYINLFYLPDSFTNRTVDEKSLALRKFVHTNNETMVQTCLENGADPYQKGAPSNKNAFDRAKENGFENILLILDKYKKSDNKIAIEAISALGALKISTDKTTEIDDMQQPHDLTKKM